MKLLLLLVACFALAVADHTVKDDVKMWIKDFKDMVNALGKGDLDGKDVKTIVKEHVNPVTLAELEVFGQLCKPSAKEGEKSSSSSSSSSSEEKKKRPKRDGKTSQLEKACVALYKNWPVAQEKFNLLSQNAKDAWDAYMDGEMETEFQLLKLEILVRWEVYVSDAKCGCDKFKLKLPKLKLKLAKRWKKFMKKAKAKFEKLGGAIKAKWAKLSGKIEANWGDFKLNVEIGWAQFKADFADFKIEFNAKLDQWKLKAKARWEKIKAAFAKAGKGIKHGFEVVGKGFVKFGKGVVKGVKKAGSKLEKFGKKVGKNIKKAFSSSSSSSSSSESKSCELETFIANTKEAKANIHALLNKDKRNKNIA